MHLDQQGADLTQGGDACRLIVDVGPTAAISRDDPAQDQFLARRDLEAALCQKRDQGLVVRGGEDGGGDGLLGARTHQPRVAARAQGQTQGVQNNGLAGPGLAGQHGQPLADIQVEGVDEDDVTDRESGQHGTA
ncbi:hypothetical protein D3C85_1218370 [compost metagenome]